VEKIQPIRVLITEFEQPFRSQEHLKLCALLMVESSWEIQNRGLSIKSKISTVDKEI